MSNNNYLIKKINPFDPEKTNSIGDLMINLQGCSFQGRRLGNTLEILTDMLKEPDCLKVLTMSGALIPAGMEKIICTMIEKKIINVIVSTGANIIHSIVNSCEKYDHQSHYIGSEFVDDSDLYKQRINRIYDVFLPEKHYLDAESFIKEILLSEFEVGKTHIITPSQLFKLIGSKLHETSFLYKAAKYNVPIFCGATSDSELALDLLVYRKTTNLNIILDEIEDINLFGEIIKKHKTHGTIILGGGVPRNWAQQIFPYLDQIHTDEDNKSFKGYKYSIRFHTAIEYDGGLSGCTINESISWGKYQSHAKHQSVWGDATILLPILITAALQRMENKKNN